MPQLTQGLIVASLIGLLLAVIVGYYLRQGQVNELTEALQQSQKRQDDLEQEHELRLREAIGQLQKDYEVQLAEKMEGYQVQFEAQRSQIETDYFARQSLIGGATPDDVSLGYSAPGALAPGEASSTTEQGIRQQLEQEYQLRLQEAMGQLQKNYEVQLVEKIDDYQAQIEAQRHQIEAEYLARQSLLGEAGPLDAAPESASTEAAMAIEQRIRKQYETRLKEAAAKIQQAYEHHLQEKLAEARSLAQQDYDQRLAEAIAHYQDDLQARLTQTTPTLPPSALVPEGILDSPLDGPAASRIAEIEARLQADYDQRLAERIAQYQDDIARQRAELEQAFADRLQLAQANAPGITALAETAPAELALNLRQELEARLQNEYEQKLAAKIEQYQDELTQRTEELEQSYDARLQLQLLQDNALDNAPAPGLAPETAPGTAPKTDSGELDLDAAIAAANQATREASLGTRLGIDDLTADDVPVTLDDLGFSDLLDSDAGVDQTDPLDLDFDTEGLDLDALLSAPVPEGTSGDLLDGLNDINELS